MKKIKSEIADVISGSKQTIIDPKHSIAVWQWVLKIKPDADIALQIAALAHDIERGVPDKIRKENFSSYEDYKEAHALKSAEVLKSILLRKCVPEKITNKAYYLVANHERGGEGDLQVLTDADSLDFFVVALSLFLEYRGLKLTKQKVNYMYKRMSSEAKIMLQEERPDIMDNIAKYEENN